MTRIKRWAILVAGAVGFALGCWVCTLGSKECAQTPGIVLIDELDIHLHPQWQRQIANGLKAAFPNIQFITASHLPQILGELKPDEIIVLTGSTKRDIFSRAKAAVKTGLAQ